MNSDLVQLYTFHLFAGVFGGGLADALLGHCPVGAIEIEPYPRSVLLARQKDGLLPAFPIWDDVCTFREDNPETAPYIEALREVRGQLAICGGYPCQGHSIAGKGRGLEDERSGLWFEYERIIREIRPRIVFVENSPMLTSRGLGRVLGGLAEMGYNARWGVLGACHAGAQHDRLRIWIYGEIPDSEKERLPGRGNGEKSGHGERELARLVGESRPWQVPAKQAAAILGMGARVPAYMDGPKRIAALGNSQVPIVAALAWETLSK